MENASNPVQSVSRRRFLKTSAGVTLFVGAAGILPQLISCRNKEAIASQIKKHTLTAWVQIAENGEVTIFNPAAEMGQGSMTSLPAIFAEEMDADWGKIKVEFSPQESDIYGSDGWGSRGKIMLSAGSRVTKGYYPIMRQAGAQTRYILMQSVAKKWEVPLLELTTKPGYVVHEESKREWSFGEIVSFIEMPETLPEFKENQLKDPGEWRIIGTVIPRTDIPAKVDGTANFAIDIRLPDMMYGVLERGTMHGAKPTLNNRTEIEAMTGVVKIVELEYAIGIIAERLEQALTAKKTLSISWKDAPTKGFDSNSAYEEYARIASSSKKGEVATDIGNISEAMSKVRAQYTVDFKNDYVYHAQMEPLNSVVQISEDGQSAEVWVGSQQGFDSKLGVPKVLGIEPKNVRINLQYLGGGFGRRSMTDFVTECAILAKEVKPKPLKLLWTREDDLTYGAYRPMSLQRLKAGADRNGNIVALSHYIVGDGDNLIASGIRNEFYDIPNQYAELRIVPHKVRLKHWRAVGHGPNKFAIECLIDEIAHDQKVDPVEYRRRLMKNAPRALATLEKAAEISNWNAPAAEGRAKGVAFLERSGTLSTGVCEISVDRASGKIKVHHFWSALDAGVVIQPDNVKAQMEGGIIMGISSVLKERLTIVDGSVQQSNFHDYPILRIKDIPDTIETEIIKSSADPQGVGESGTPLVAGAIANAFLALTGKRLRHLPFTEERVLEALSS